MKIAIHNRKNSFSERWIDYCIRNNIDHKIVNAFDTDLIEQICDCDVFMWHHHHNDFKDVLTAKRILFALEQSGIKVFPNFHTGWHFDDKVAQKYLLEAIGAPLVPSYVFYKKKDAINWVEKTSFPKVFKLKGGAGSANVKLVKNKKNAIKLINVAFGKGFEQFDRLGNLKERVRLFKEGKGSLSNVLKGVGRAFITTNFSRMQGVENGYVYFQDFVPDLDSDIRLQIIGDHIFGLKRFVRRGDFRASGSGNFIEFSPNNIDVELLKIAIDVNKKIKSQCLTIDFIYNGLTPQIVELSYGFPVSFYDNCSGYWDLELRWHDGKFNPQEWMLEKLLSESTCTNLKL
ncbi:MULTISPECIES: hypothetical protein [unclassified Vibrio]|uniref:ATP-grasp domain-containing protein n=1 Tax=Vibrio TaxID=662 RepID=UPI0014832749|nr:MULTISPECIES: hypothetical protein [unclassified Vibrio]NNN41952.1 hypothetical protein [Vibrio sp. 2-2(2)]NNO05050.1 hypothetical protein [Vibrio sp. 7-5(1-a)]